VQDAPKKKKKKKRKTLSIEEKEEKEEEEKEEKEKEEEEEGLVAVIQPVVGLGASDKAGTKLAQQAKMPAAREGLALAPSGEAAIF
jgi:hypothetical protein